MSIANRYQVRHHKNGIIYSAPQLMLLKNEVEYCIEMKFGFTIVDTKLNKEIPLEKFKEILSQHKG